MKILGKVLRLAGSVVGLLLAAVVALYLMILVVNWRDQPVGAAAARLEQIARNAPVVAATDNGYHYLIRLGAMPERRTFSRYPPIDRYKPLTDECSELDLACYHALDSHAALIDALLKEEEWLLERYQILLDRPSWHAAGPGVQTGSVDAISAGFDGQRMLMQLAWTRAAASDAAGVRQLLEKDIRFWRMVLASSGDLISKEVAGWALRRHFDWANIVLRKLPADRQLQAVPRQWRTPITLEERSLLRPLAGEQYKIKKVFDVFEEQHDRTEVFDWLLVKLAAPMAQRQDYLNRYSALVMTISDTLDVPHESFPAALRRAKGLVSKARDEAFDGWAYNLIGNVELRLRPLDITEYGVAAADLEGVRRAAILTAQLRSEGVTPEQVPSRLAASTLRDPYTGAPFAWEAKARAVVFSGLEPGQGGRHPILY